MSIAVALEDIPQAIAGQIGWCYLLTVSDDGRARVFAVAPYIHDDGTLRFEAGRGTAANAASRPTVTLVYPPVDPTSMSLIVDGDAVVDGSTITIAPTWAVMHRSAIPPKSDT